MELLIFFLLVVLFILCYNTIYEILSWIFDTIADGIESVARDVGYMILHHKYPRYRVYRVLNGDTYLGIARRYNIDTNTILIYNKIKNPNIIFVGQKIKIPLIGRD